MGERIEPTDEELTRRARASHPDDLRAFDLLVERHRGGVVGNCRYLTGSRDDAEDLAQEVFVKAYFGLRSFEGRSAFRTWLHRIKVNHCLSWIEKRGGRSYVEIDDPGIGESPEMTVPSRAEANLWEADERRRIAAVLDGMPDTLRVPLILRDMDQMSYEEIAEALGIGLSAAKMRIKRGREEFRRRFGREPERPAAVVSAAPLPEAT